MQIGGAMLDVDSPQTAFALKIRRQHREELVEERRGNEFNLLEVDLNSIGSLSRCLGNGWS